MKHSQTASYNNLSGKVIHVGVGIHAVVKEFCRERNLHMRNFTEEALDRAMFVTKEEESYETEHRKNKNEEKTSVSAD